MALDLTANFAVGYEREKYLSRIADKTLDLRLEAFGAVHIAPANQVLVQIRKCITKMYYFQKL